MKNDEKMVLYNSQMANEDETRGRTRALSPEGTLKLYFNVKHLMHLFKTSERTVINIILT